MMADNVHVMPANASTSLLRRFRKQDVDGRDIGERSDAVLRTAMPGHDGGRSYATVPSPARRSTLPGSAPVWVASSTTTVPLTMTVVRVPLGYWCGSA